MPGDRMAKKRLNKNMIVALTLFSLAMLVVLSVLILRQVMHRDPSYFVALAVQSEREGDLQSAKFFYNKAWERSNDATYLVSIGELFRAEGDVGQALASWSAALVNAPELSEAHLHLLDLRLEIARLYDQSDHWKAVRDGAEAFLDAGATLSRPDEAKTRNANGLALIRLARLGEGNAQIGEADLQRATELAPDVADYKVDLARHWVAHGRADDGERLFRSTIIEEVTPGIDAVRIRTAFAEYLVEQNQSTEAEALFEESLSLSGDSASALGEARTAFALFLAQRWAAEPNRTDLFDRAEGLLEAETWANPDGYDAYLQLATLYGSARRHEDVVASCDRRLERGLVRKGARVGRNRVDAFSLMVFASEACISEAVGKHDAGLEEERQDWLERAEQYIERARAELPSNPRVLMQLARLKLARGLDRQALEDLRAAQDGYRTAGQVNWDNTMTLARLHLSLKETGAAMVVMEEVLDAARRERSGDVRFWTLFAQVLFQGKEFDRALAYCDRILQVDSANVTIVPLKVMILQAQGRIDDAGRMAQQLSDDPITVTLVKTRGLILIGNYEAAYTTVYDALRQYSSDPRLVGTAVRILLHLDRAEEARDLVEVALRDDGDNTQLQMLHVLTRTDLSARARDEAILKFIDDEEDAYQRTLALIDFYLGKRDHENLLLLLNEGIQHLTDAKTPTAQRAAASQLRILLETKLTVAAALKDTAAMDSARDAAVEFNVDGAGGKSLEGLYFMHLEDFDAAVNAFREALKAQPTDARVLAHLGQCHQILLQNDEARSFFDRALQVNPDEGIAHKGLAMLAKAANDRKADDRHFDLAKGLLANDLWVQAEILEREEADDPETAIERRESLRAEQPDDVSNLMRLAALHEAVGSTARADATYTQALASAPGNKELVVAAAAFYRRTGRPDDSLNIITRYIVSQVTVDDTARGHLLLASHHLAVGDMTKAERALTDAAEIAQSVEVMQSLAEFYLRAANRPTEALAWFEKAISTARSTQSPRLPRLLTLRVSCLLQPGMDETEKAEQACEELLTDFPDYPQGLLLLSEIRSREGDIEGAVNTITDYLRFSPNDPKALFHRAGLYLANGRIGPAIEDLEFLKRTSPLALDLEPRMRLATLKRHTGRIDQAIRELEALVTDAPDSSKALQALVELYIEENRFTDADRLITGRINRARETPAAHWFFLRGRTALELGNFGTAISDAKRGAEINGYDTLSVRHLLDTCLRAGRASEGIAFYEQHAPQDSAPPALVSQYARLLLMAGHEEEAVGHFRMAMALAIEQPADVVGMVSGDLSVAFPDAASVERAIKLFERSAPDGTMGRVNDRIRVRLYRLDSRIDAAAEILNDLIGSCQDSHERALLYHELGDLYQTALRPLDARHAYEDALRFNNGYWITLNNLASVLSDSLSEDALAEGYAKRAMEAADNSDTRDTLGWIYVRLADYARGIAHLTQTVRRGSRNPLHFYHLGEAYRRNEQRNVAASILQTGRQLARRVGDSDLARRFDDSIDRNSRSDSSP